MNHILDDTIRREAQLQRFASFMVKEYVNPTAQDLSREIPSLLIGYEDLDPRQQQALFSRIRQITEQSWGGIWAGVDGQWPELMQQEANFQYELYDDFAPETLVNIDANMVTIPPMVVGSASAVQAGVWAQYVTNNISDTVRRVDGLVQRGVREGLTVDDMTRQLRGRYDRRTKEYKGGTLTGLQSKRAEALVRTGVSHHTNAVRDAFAEDNDDVVTARIFFATLDNRTTTICLSNHLREWKIDDKSYPRLPLHFNERSVYILKTKGLNPLDTTRRVKGGKPGDDEEYDFETIKANVSSSTWLKRQPRWFIEESLGKERAKLFIDGGLDINSFVDITNRPLTLEELKNTAAGARAFRKSRG